MLHVSPGNAGVAGMASMPSCGLERASRESFSAADFGAARRKAAARKEKRCRRLVMVILFILFILIIAGAWLRRVRGGQS